MKRIFYGIGFFFAAFFLICGFLMSYQIAGLQEQLKELEEESTKMGKQVSALPLSKNSSLIFGTVASGLISNFAVASIFSFPFSTKILFISS